MAPLRCTWCWAGIQPGEPVVMVEPNHTTCGEPCAKMLRAKLKKQAAHRPRRQLPPLPADAAPLRAQRLRRELAELFPGQIVSPRRVG